MRRGTTYSSVMTRAQLIKVCLLSVIEYFNNAYDRFSLSMYTNFEVCW